jgi:hypothetical protein
MQKYNFYFAMSMISTNFAPRARELADIGKDGRDVFVLFRLPLLPVPINSKKQESEQYEQRRTNAQGHRPE